MITIYNNAKDFNSTTIDTAVLPIGAVEQHGTHLPVGTDTFIVGEVAKRVAEKLNAYLLPVIPISCSIEHRDNRGTVYLKAETLTAVIRDIAYSLNYSKYKKLIVISGHGGNWVIKPAIRELNRELEHMSIYLVGTSTIASKRVNEIMEHTQNDIHAGEKETSMMLYLLKEHVADIDLQNDFEYQPQDFLDYFDISKVTKYGYWGYPEAATAEKGEKMLNLLVDCTIEYLGKVETLKEELINKIPVE